MTDEELKEIVSKDYLATQIKNYDDYRNLKKAAILNDSKKIKQVNIPDNVVTTDNLTIGATINTADGSMKIGDTDYKFLQKGDSVDTVNGKKGDVEINASNLNYDDSNSIKSTIDIVKAAVNNLIPIGTIMPYVGETAPDDTWAICGFDCYVMIEGHEELYMMIGDRYTPKDVGVQEDRFYLPNLQGRFLEGCTAINIGSMIAAGIPDVHGFFSIEDGAFFGGHGGAFCSTSGSVPEDPGTGNIGPQRQYFVESEGEWDTENNKYKSESGKTKVYGKSDTVQPAAFRVNYIMKIAHEDI